MPKRRLGRKILKRKSRTYNKNSKRSKQVVVSSSSNNKVAEVKEAKIKRKRGEKVEIGHIKLC